CVFYGFCAFGLMAGLCFLPHMPSLAFSIIGLYFFQRWTDASDLATGRVRPIGGPEWRARSTSFFASAFCISLSILIKLPSILVGAPLACLALQRFRSSSFKRFDLWSFAAIALLPSVFWYGHAYQIALQFYPHHFFGAGGVQIMSAAWYLKISKEIVK